MDFILRRGLGISLKPRDPFLEEDGALVPYPSPQHTASLGCRHSVSLVARLSLSHVPNVWSAFTCKYLSILLLVSFGIL